MSVNPLVGIESKFVLKLLYMSMFYSTTLPVVVINIHVHSWHFSIDLHSLIHTHPMYTLQLIDLDHDHDRMAATDMMMTHVT